LKSWSLEVRCFPLVVRKRYNLTYRHTMKVLDLYDSKTPNIRYIRKTRKTRNTYCTHYIHPLLRY
jgi:hypothetical protein